MKQLILTQQEKKVLDDGFQAALVLSPSGIFPPLDGQKSAATTPTTSGAVCWQRR